MTSAIELDNLSKKFGEVTAVDSLDLKVTKGSIFGFLGPNGAGKTTTIKILMGLAKPSLGSAKSFADKNCSFLTDVFQLIAG